jgi:hypothetical protein
VIPPEQSADFVANMEDVLELYQQPYDPKYPVVNMDEKPMQLIKETRQPLPAKPEQPLRYDYEYEWVGTANVFLFTEPLTGWRTVDVCEYRTAIDWAIRSSIFLMTVTLMPPSSAWYATISTPIRPPRSMRPSSLKRPADWPADWSATTRPNTAAG